MGINTMSSPSHKWHIGIDLGTTNSSICHTDFNSGKGQFDDPLPVRFGDSKTLRSILLLDSSREKVITSGVDVYSHPDYHQYPERVYEEFKLRFGIEPVAETCTRLLIEELMLGIKNSFPAKHISPTTCDTTVGVPAEWEKKYPERVKLVQMAVESVGFPEPKVVPEPVAAMQYHAFLGDIAYKNHPQRWLVIDFGGGTTDLALIQTQDFGRQPTVLNTFGQIYGGKDFDQLLIDRFIPRFWSGPSSTPSQQLELLMFVREFKEEFSNEVVRGKPGHTKSYRKIPQLRNPVELTYEEFASEELAGPLIDQFSKILQRGFETFGGGLRNIDRIILTGGSSRWVFVRRFLEFFFDSDACLISKNPELTIAKGLALAHTGFKSPSPIRETAKKEKPSNIGVQGRSIIDKSTPLGSIELQDDDSKLTTSLDRRTCRTKARERTRWYASGGGVGAALVSQVPGAASAALPAIEAKLVLDISQIYGYKLETNEIMTVVGGLVASGMVVKMGVMELVGMIPVAGNLIKGGAAAAFILGLGEAAIKYFEIRRFGGEELPNL